MPDRRRRVERVEARAKAAFDSDVAAFGRVVSEAYAEAVNRRTGSDYLPPLCEGDLATVVLAIDEQRRHAIHWKSVEVGGRVWSRAGIRCSRWRPAAHVMPGRPGESGSGGDLVIQGGQGASTGVGGQITFLVDGQARAMVLHEPSPLDPEHLLLVAGWDPMGDLRGIPADTPPHRWGVAYTTWPGRALAAFMTDRVEDEEEPVAFGLVEIDYSLRETWPFHGRDALWDAVLGGGQWRRPLRGKEWTVLPDVPWKVLMAWAEGAAGEG